MATAIGFYDAELIVEARTYLPLLLAVAKAATSMHSVYESNDEWKQQLGNAIAALEAS